MLYTGKFKNRYEETIRVDITTNNDTSSQTELTFADESPVVISQESGDNIYAPIKSRGCTITIVTKEAYFDMYSASSHGTQVVVTNEATDECLFYGFLTPCEYNQSYTYLDTLELEAVDALSTLQDYKYEYLNGTESNQVSMAAIVKHFIKDIATYNGRIYMPYLGLKMKVAHDLQLYPMEIEMISEEAFFSDDGEPMTCYDVLSEICMFYNMSVVPHGRDVYFVDYEAVVNHATIGDIATSAKTVNWDVIDDYDDPPQPEPVSPRRARSIDDNYEYLTFTIEDACDITFTATNNNVLNYSTDGGMNWSELASGTPLSVSAGDEILFKGQMTPVPAGIGTFSVTGNFRVHGNIMSLLYGDSFDVETDLTGYDDVFNGLFRDCTYLLDASDLELPATVLADECYKYMFYGCSSLVSAPSLPATTLSDWCYQYMFGNCTSLKTAPSLSTTTLAPYCYANMFSGCTRLVNAPELPATTLEIYCYSHMFSGCTSLVNAPELPSPYTADFCYAGMFYNCTSLLAAPALPAETMTQFCYNGMFRGCTSLVFAPDLPARTLAISCYNGMFEGCTSLTRVPSSLPATTLIQNCYANMFKGCTRITKTPDLPATTLVQNCYANMFQNCSNLARIKALFTTTPDTTTTNNWVDGVAAEGLFIKNPSATWSVVGADGVPTGWNVTDIDPDNYLTIEALGTGTVTINTPSGSSNTFYVSTNGGDTWSQYQQAISVNDGDRVLVKKRSISNLGSGTVCYFRVTCQYNLSGNITSLLYRDDETRTLTAPDYCFRDTFVNNTNLISAKNLLMPATTVGITSYQEMFSGCTNMVDAPALPATTLGTSCYCKMFEFCSSLVSPPALPATILTEGCYEYMFQHCTSLIATPKLYSEVAAVRCYAYMFRGCTSLVSATELPAMTLARLCYTGMFDACRNLTVAPALPATTLANSCYASMFNRCSSLTTAPFLPATTLPMGCYEYMFSGCTSLNYIKASFLNLNDEFPQTMFWVENVADRGTFVKRIDAEWEDVGVSGIPVGWTVVLSNNITEKWKDLITNIEYDLDTQQKLSKADYAGEDQNIELDEVYNKVIVTADINEVDDDEMFTDPMDDANKSTFYDSIDGYMHRTDNTDWVHITRLFQFVTSAEDPYSTYDGNWRTYVNNNTDNNSPSSLTDSFSHTFDTVREAWWNHPYGYYDATGQYYLFNYSIVGQTCLPSQQFGYESTKEVPIKANWDDRLLFFPQAEWLYEYYKNKRIYMPVPTSWVSMRSSKRKEWWYNYCDTHLCVKPVLEFTGTKDFQFSPADSTKTNYLVFQGDLLWQRNCNYDHVNYHLWTADETNHRYDATLFPIKEAGASSTDNIETREVTQETSGKNNLGWNMLKIKLQIGGKYWNGSTWQEEECTAWIPYHKDTAVYNGDDEELIWSDYNKPVTNYDYKSNINVEGYAIPVYDTDMLYGKMTLSIYMPLLPYSNDVIQAPSMVSGRYRLNYLKTPPVIFMKNMGMSLVSVNNNSIGRQWIEDGIEKADDDDDDITYENIISTKNVTEMDELELGINTYNDEKPVAQSYIIEPVISDSVFTYKILSDDFSTVTPEPLPTIGGYMYSILLSDYLFSDLTPATEWFDDMRSKGFMSNENRGIPVYIKVNNIIYEAFLGNQTIDGVQKVVLRIGGNIYPTAEMAMEGNRAALTIIGAALENGYIEFVGGGSNRYVLPASLYPESLHTEREFIMSNIKDVKYHTQGFYRPLTKTAQRQEMNIVDRYVGHYSSPKKIYNCVVHDYYKPYLCVEPTALSGSHMIVDQQSWDVKANINELKLIEV